MKIKSSTQANSQTPTKSEEKTSKHLKSDYLRSENILTPQTPAFIMGHFTKNSSGELELTTNTSIPWWDLRTLWQQPLIINSSEKKRVESLRMYAKGFHLTSVLLVTFGLGTVVYDQTKFTPN
jgi:hypothetical protein